MEEGWPSGVSLHTLGNSVEIIRSHRKSPDLVCTEHKLICEARGLIKNTESSLQLTRNHWGSPDFVKFERTHQNQTENIRTHQTHQNSLTRNDQNSSDTIETHWSSLSIIGNSKDKMKITRAHRNSCKQFEITRNQTRKHKSSKQIKFAEAQQKTDTIPKRS